MIERIEEFGPKLNCGSLANECALVQGEVPIVDSGPWKKRRFAFPVTQGLGRKWSRIEEWFPGLRGSR